jgi:hypothetical protein
LMGVEAPDESLQRRRRLIRRRLRLARARRLAHAGAWTAIAVCAAGLAVSFALLGRP